MIIQMATFYEVISDTTKKNKLLVTSDLFKLCDAITSLPIKEKQDYAAQITDILSRIPNYLLNSNSKQREQYTYALEKSYRSELFILLHNIIFKIDHQEPYLPRPKTHTSSYPFVTNSSKPINIVNPKEKTLADYDKEIEKAKEEQKELEPKLLEWHKDTSVTTEDYNANYKAVPEMINAIRELILSIRKNVMSSQVTEFILLFEDINKVILSEHPDQMTISTLVNDCLKDNGWSASGFYSQPDKTKLTKIAKELHQILEIIA